MSVKKLVTLAWLTVATAVAWLAAAVRDARRHAAEVRALELWLKSAENCTYRRPTFDEWRATRGAAADAEQHAAYLEWARWWDDLYGMGR